MVVALVVGSRVLVRLEEANDDKTADVALEYSAVDPLIRQSIPSNASSTWLAEKGVSVGSHVGRMVLRSV